MVAPFAMSVGKNLLACLLARNTTLSYLALYTGIAPNK
jgi:hypothetical protein